MAQGCAQEGPGHAKPETRRPKAESAEERIVNGAGIVVGMASATALVDVGSLMEP
jgi:hypothetical protein